MKNFQYFGPSSESSKTPCYSRGTPNRSKSLYSNRISTEFDSRKVQSVTKKSNAGCYLSRQLMLPYCLGQFVVSFVCDVRDSLL